MIEMKHLHRHSPPSLQPCTSTLNAVMNPLVLSDYGGTVSDNYSLSSSSTSAVTESAAATVAASTACENQSGHIQNLKDTNQSNSLCNSSSVGDSSSAASSIDYFCFSPPPKRVGEISEEEEEEEESQTPEDQGISLTISSTSTATSTSEVDNSSFSQPTTTTTTASAITTTTDAEIDEFVLSMLNSAKELSTLEDSNISSSRNTPSPSFLSSKSLQRKNFEMKEKPIPQNNCIISPKIEIKNTDLISATPPPNSPKESVDELNFSKVDSLIKELDEASSKSRPQPTPKFLKMDDQYTTNNYVSLVRDITEKQIMKRSKDDALIRTSSWAANLATLPPPPLPVTSVPSTPIMSRYRIMNSSMKVSPDERMETPTSTKSADNDGYFLHYEDRLRPVKAKFSNIASKLVHGQRLKPMSLTMNHPTLENSEASLTRSDTFGERHPVQPIKPFSSGALVMRNAAFEAAATLPLVNRHFNDFTYLSRSNEKMVNRSDELLDYESDYLYDIQCADKLNAIHELAWQEISTYVERPVGLRIKEWSLKLDVVRNIRNKFGRTPPSDAVMVYKLFGMPLHMVQAKNGNGCPFPKFVMDIMDYLKESAINMDGLFRRCGSQKRINEMREICNDLDCHDPLPEDFKTTNQANDLSDLLKQYLRALPQKLIPENISEVVTSAISENPPEKHMDIMKLVVLIMPDEHRDALLIFLDFLSDISRNSSHNLMTVDNLSICTMPTVFTLSEIASQPLTPSRRRKTVAIMNNKDAIQYKSLKEALSVLINGRAELERIPINLLKAANSKPLQRKKKKELKDAMPPISEIGAASSLRCFVATLFKEYDEYWKSWHIESINDKGIIFATREVDDSCALKSCRLQLTVPATPQNVVSCLINHREKWDLITTSTKPEFIDVANKEYIAHITFNNFNKDSVKKAIVARIWEDGEPGTGRAFVAEKSCKRDPFSVNVEVYHSAFIICPFNGKSVINYVSRIDLKGKSISWYEKTYRQLLISQMTRLAYLLKHLSE